VHQRPRLPGRISGLPPPPLGRGRGHPKGQARGGTGPARRGHRGAPESPPPTTERLTTTCVSCGAELSPITLPGAWTCEACRRLVPQPALVPLQEAPMTDTTPEPAAWSEAAD